MPGRSALTQSMFGKRSGSRIVGEQRRPANSGPQTGPNASTSKHATRSVSQPRSSAPFGRSSLASGAATPTRQSQSAIKRLPSRQGSSATTDSVSVLTHQASIATAALRREQAAFNGSDSRTGRAASASPGKSTGPSKSQDANAQSMFRDSAHGRRSGAGSSFASSGPQTPANPGRTVSPPKTTKQLLGKAHTSAAAVSKILQIAQQSKQHQSLPSLGPRQESPLDTAAQSSHQRWRSAAQLGNQRATYPGASAFEDEAGNSALASEHSGGPPAVYNMMPSTSLSAPGNVPGAHTASRPTTSRLRTQAAQRLSSPEADVPRVFATPGGAAPRAEEAHPEHSMQQRASAQQRVSTDRRPARPAFTTYGRPPGPGPTTSTQGPHGRSKSTMPSPSPSRSPAPSTSPPLLPGSHSAAAVARRQQRIAQQLEANPPPPPEEIVPIGTGKKLSMAKLAELSKPKPKRVAEPEPLPPPKLAFRRPSRPSQSPSKVQQHASVGQKSQPALQKSPSKIAQLKTTHSQSKASQLQTKTPQPPSKLMQPQSNYSQSPSKLSQPQSKIAQLQTKSTAPQSKLAQPASKLSQLKRPGQAATAAAPSPELQAILDQAKEAKDQLAKLTQVKDVTNGSATSDPNAGSVSQSNDPVASQSQATGARAEAAAGQQTDHAKRPSGIFGALGSLWWKAPAAPPPQDSSAQETEQKQELQEATVPENFTIEEQAPVSAEHVQPSSEELPDIIDVYQESDVVDATAESEKRIEEKHSAEHSVLSSDVQQMHSQEHSRHSQQQIHFQERSRPSQQQTPPASATAPFATEDTPVHIATSITRPSQNAVLPQSAFNHNTSQTMKERQLLSQPVEGSEQPDDTAKSPISARRPHPMESIRFLQQPQTHALVALHDAEPSSHQQNATQPTVQDLIRLDSSPLASSSGQLQSSQGKSGSLHQVVLSAQDEAANLLYPGKSTSAALSDVDLPQRRRSKLQSSGHPSANQDEVGQLLYPGKKPSSDKSTKLNSNTLDAPSGVLTPVPVSFNHHPSHARVPSHGSFMLPNLPMPASDAAVPISQVPGSPDAQSESKSEDFLNQTAAEKDDDVPVVYSIAPQFNESAFLQSSNDSRRMHPSSGASSLGPSPGTSSKLPGNSQIQQQTPQVPVFGLSGGNVLDAPVLSGSGVPGRRKASRLSELQPGLSPMQQAMQKRAQAGLKADLEKQIAEKKRKEAEEKAAKRAEDTQEERKVLNYLSTQAAHLETRAMSPLVGGGFPQGSLPEGLATSTTVVPGTRLSYVDLTRPERRSFGTDESLLGSPTRHLRGASNGSWSGPMGPAGSVQQPGHSNSLSSFGAGDSSAQDPHMTALNTVLGVDFIQDAPPRGNGSGPGPEAHTVRPHAPRWAQSGAEAADIGGTALPDLLREVQEDRMRLQAQHAEQLAGFAMEPSDRLPDDPDYEEHHLRKNQAAAAAEQLAYMEDLLRHPEKLAAEEFEGTGTQSSLRIGGGGLVSPPNRFTPSSVRASQQKPSATRIGSTSSSHQQQKRPVGTWGTAATGRSAESRIRGSRTENRTSPQQQERVASPPTLDRAVSQDRLRTQSSTGHPLHTGMSRSLSPDTPGAIHSRRGSASHSPPPSAPSSRRVSGNLGPNAYPHSRNASQMSSVRHNPVPSYISQHSHGPSGFAAIPTHSPAPSMGSSGYSRITRHGYSHAQDELVASSFLLPPSLDFVPDDPERVRLSEAAVSAFQSGRMRSASQARYPGTSPNPPEAPGNFYILPDDDDEVRMGQSYPGSPELPADALQHVHDGLSNPSLTRRGSSTSPLRHGFSKSISEHTFAVHHHRHSTGDNLSFDTPADETPWGHKAAARSRQPVNLLTSAAMQVLQGNDEGDSAAAGAERRRRLGRQGTPPHNSMRPANPLGPGRSNTGSMTRNRSSTSLGNSSRVHSRQLSRHGSPGMSSGQNSQPKSRTPKPVGFGSGTPSSRAPSGLHTRRISMTDRAAHSASPARRVSNAGSLHTNEALVSRQQSSVGRGRISLRDRGQSLNTSSMAGLGSLHTQRDSYGRAGTCSGSFGLNSNAGLGGRGLGASGTEYMRGRR